LTPKQRVFADTLLETGVQTTAALAAYDTDDYFNAAVIGHENLKKVKIVQYINDRCAKANLTVDRVLGQLSSELDAERVVQTADGTQLGREPDWNARHRAIETSIKYVLPEFLELRQAGGERPAVGSQHIHLHNLPVERLKELAAGKKK
jgi:phage terminase small subunit